MVTSLLHVDLEVRSAMCLTTLQCDVGTTVMALLEASSVVLDPERKLCRLEF
jgi:hypothetical protein